MDLSGLLSDPQFRLGLGLFGASGPMPGNVGFGQRLMMGVGSFDDWDVQQKKLKIAEEEEKRRKLLSDMQIKKLQEDMADEDALKTLLQKPEFWSKSKQGLQVGTDISSTGPELATEQVPLDPREQAMKFIASGNKLLAKQGLATLASLKDQDPYINAGGGALFNRRTGQWETAPQKPTDEWEELPSRSPGGQMLQRNKKTGEIKAVGLGPQQPNSVVIQQQGKEEAKGRVSGLVQTLQKYYDDLEEARGAVKAGQPPLENAANIAMNTMPGQYLGRALGTQAQVARDGIAAMRPALINEIRNATNMSARAMDSNVELQFNIKMATDPGVDPSINRAALERIDKQYGLGWGITSTPEGRNRLNSIEKKDQSGKSPIGNQGGLTRGQVVNGYMYLGGNPNDPNSWAKTP